MVEIQSWTVGPFAENAYLLACAQSRQAILVDPGDDAPRLLRVIETAGVAVVAILLTHAHLDHVAALTELRETMGAPVYLHPDDDELLREAPVYWREFGRQVNPIAPADHALSDDMRLSFGECEGRVIHTPGHTPGSVCFYLPDDGALIAGDTLFFHSVGRTDMPGGDLETLLASIRTKLWQLPDETSVYPGHGQKTTIGHERRLNPFVGNRAR